MKVTKTVASTSSVYLALVASNGALLQGPLMIADGTGTVTDFTFAGLKINTAGTGYKLMAVSSSFPSQLSNAFNINAGASASVLKFTTPPPVLGLTSSICPVAVTAYDSTGANAVTTFTASVTLSLMIGATASTMTPVTISAASGVATFSSCPISGTGTFRLKATSAGLTDALSDEFTVSASTLSSITLDKASYTATLGQSLALTAKCYDQTSTLKTDAAVLIGLSATGPGALTGTIQLTTAAGQGSFSVGFSQAGTYTVKVTCGSCSGVTLATATVTVTGSAAAAIKISYSSALVQGLPNQSYSVVLSSVPTADVYIAISSVDTTRAQVLTASLKFTTANYNTPQSVSIDVLPFPTASSYSDITIKHVATSADPNYSGTSMVTGCGVSNGVATIPVSGSKGYIVDIGATVYMQEGETSTYAVKLLKAPANDVIVSLSYPSSAYYLVSPTTLTFTSGTWSTPQTVTVSSAINPTPTTGTTFAIVHTVSGDLNYVPPDAMHPPDGHTHVHIAPRSSDAIVLSGSIVMKDRGRGWYTVRLNSLPTATVTVTLSSSSAAVTLSPTTLTFTSSNYGIPAHVNVYANSAVAVDATITHTAAGGSYAGKTASNVVTVMNVCESYAFSWPSGTDCKVCMAGFDCTGDDPVACPLGYYNNPGTAVQCTICPAGMKCPDPTAGAVACAAGTYSRPGAVECTKCPSGMMCPNADGTGMKVCDEGSYAVGGATTCTLCTAGKYCPSIHEASEFACPSGWTSDAGASVCIPCVEGYTCTAPTATTACAAGKFALKGFSSCTDCPANMECLIDSGPYRLCAEGSYATLGTCTSCDAGNSCSLANPGSKACTAGTYSRAGSSVCLPCPLGSSCATTTALPTACATGTYSLGGTVASCTACPSGYYSLFTGMARCERCPAGFECTGAAVAPVICGKGKYSYAGAATCTNCQAGYSCPAGSVRPDPPGYECAPGRFCDGSGTSATQKCAAGTYNPYIRGASASDCFTCPNGKDCPAGTAVPVDCPQGKYCWGGTTTDCPVGFYNPTAGGRSLGDCLLCPQGFFCTNVATVTPSICTPGNICPLGSANQVACPAGTYNPFSGKYQIEDCLPCPAGAYCISASPSPRLCLEGTYNPNIGAGDSRNCKQCEPGKVCNSRGLARPPVNCLRGYFCPLGSIYQDANPCPPGTYSDGVNLRSAEECIPCPVGKACYQGTTFATMAACAAGYYCPLGTTDPYANPCPAGTYTARTDATTLSDCLPCPPGKACKRATSTPLACTAGYYCPVGTTEPDLYPCPAGTFSTSTTLARAEQCTVCSKGKYCPEASTAEISCPTNTYNDATGAKSKGPAATGACKQCPGGSTCNGTGLQSPTPCGAGNYSPVGATSCTTCQIGYYCDLASTSFAAMVKKPCPPGYLCPAGTAVNPYSSSTYLCPVGKYCPEATTAAKDCPIGTYRNTKGAASIGDCKPTPAGFYSDVPGTSDYTAKLCQAGYYCPAGSTSATQNSCPPGTFRSTTGGGSANDCVPCTAGLYCSASHTTAGTNCPVAYYCPTGSVNPTKCPRGTYSNTLKLETSDQCTACDPGKYCATAGQTTYTGDCQAGYYCKGGAYSDTPVDGTTGSLCPAGGYCPAGTPTVQSCPDGKYNNFSGAQDVNGCSPCRPGYYCAGSLTSTPTGKCQEGYYCAAGSTTATPAGATAGFYAPAGSIAPIPCAPGTFNPSANRPKCDDCTIGSYCPTTQMTAATSCSAGFYCPLATVSPIPCPQGTYRDTQGAKAVGECLACTGGNYCNKPGSIAVTGQCKAGFFCKSGAKVDAPVVLSSGNYGPCPVGYYCPLGTEDPTACPIGTYNPSEQATKLADCLPCLPGYGCTILGKSTIDVADLCTAGYYCESGSTALSNEASKCDPGYKCPAGSAAKVKCPPGYYQNQYGQATCLQCPTGYYCPAGTGDFTLNSCPKGYYCPSGTEFSTQYPCAPGTYNDQFLGQDNTACKACPAGSYCAIQAAPSPTGSCDPGFYCTGGAKVARPTSALENGGRCGPGYYCPPGSIAPQPCMGGFYCAGDQLAVPSGNCKPGYYCTSLATVPTPTDGTTGNICPAGKYCASGSSTPTSCNTGTYLPYQGASQASECMPCIPGYYCDEIALTNPYKTCVAGFYCPSGQTASILQCDKGYYCPAGSAQQTKCPAGQYQDTTGQINCKACTAGNYCLQGAQLPVKCPKGYYCPAGTSYQYANPCPAGTYNGFLGKSASTDCVTCEAGKYCESNGLDAPTGQCSGGYYCGAGSTIATQTICPAGTYCPVGSTAATPCPGGVYCNQDGQASVTGSCLNGYYCIGGSTKPNPTDGTLGNLCDQGKYCPSGSAAPVNCQAGTYSNALGLSANTDCFPCPYGSYCVGSGITAPTGVCDAGFYCTPGSTSNQPSDSICASGYECPAGSFEQHPCPMGTFTTLTAQAACDPCTEGYYCTGGTALPMECPKGYYCPGGVRFNTEFECPDGKYSDTTGNKACSVCPAGKQCNNAAITMTSMCAVYLYCPAGTGYGLICPAGTYNPSSTTLTAASECQSCPAGFYCVDGRISGQCEPGYYCKSGSATPTPTNNINGYPCPAGNYCERATSTPTLCPKGKFRSEPGGRQITDCTDCPPGYYCPPSSGSASVPILCPVGNYCPQGSQSPLPCPIRRYNPTKGSSTSEACVACPAGYLCLEKGIGDFNVAKYYCPVAYFCVEGAAFPVPCPPGTFRSTPRAGSPADCEPCTGGNQCPGKTSITYGCPEGTYCPVGASGPWLCLPGAYCPANTTDPNNCPGGSYCPKVTQDQVDLALVLVANNCTNSTSNSTEVLPPYKCPTEAVCPSGSFDPQLCSPGKYVYNNACKLCPAGTYSKATGKFCQKCYAGYLCISGATRPNPTVLSLHGGTLCPAGYYCGEGAVTPTPCGIGTYNPTPGGTNSTACIVSPANYYADKTALAAVTPCGASAWSTEGSVTCQCKGAFRSYLKTDSSCRCVPGYESTPEGITVAEQDGTPDCWPKSVEVCSGIRAPNGKCDPDCSQECTSTEGSRLSGSGLCVCSDVKDISEICDGDCRLGAPSVTLRADGFYEVTYGTYTTLAKVKDLPGYYGATSGSGQVYSVNMTEQGPTSTYGLGETVGKLVTLPGVSKRTASTPASRRTQEQSALDSVVPDPVLCVHENDTFLFAIPDRTHYPVYLKDSLLNTNPYFDYAPFLELKRLVKSELSYVTTFAFTFVQQGLYDFADGENEDKHILVAVIPIGKTCPQSAPVLTRTADTMNTLDFQVADTIEGDNWLNIGMVMLGLVLLFLVVSGGLYTYKWWKWTPAAVRSQTLAKLRRVLCCGWCRRRRLEPPVEEEEPLEGENLEATLFQSMFDKLKSHEAQLNKGFALQSEESAKHLQDVLSQAERLRDLLEEKLGALDPALLRPVEDFPEEEEDEGPMSPKGENVIQKWSSSVFASLLKRHMTNTDLSGYRLQISSDADLSEEDKKELMSDLQANMQRIENANEADRRRAQEVLEQRLKEKRARRRQAKNKVLDLEWQRQEMLKRQEAEKNLLKQQFQDDTAQLEKETGSEKLKIKREERQDLERKLDELRSQLQMDLARSQNKEETEDLMKSYELEARRVEQQLMQASQKREQELLRRLEERRKARLKAKQNELDAKLTELENRHAQELSDLTSAKARIGLIDESAEVPPLDATEVAQTIEKQRGEKEDLELKHQQEQADLQAEMEQGDLAAKKNRLQQEILTAPTPDQKQALMEELEAADVALKREEAEQGDRFREQLRQRRQQRAAKQLALKQKQREEAEALELEQELEAERAQHNAEMKRINDILAQQEGASAEQLAALLRRLLDEKHEKELSELTAKKQKRLRDKQTQLLGDQLDQKSNKMSDIRSRFSDLKAALERKKGQMSKEQFEEEQNRLIKEEHDALQQMDFDFMADMNFGQSSNLETVEEEFRQRYLALIQRQMQEVADVLNRIKLIDWNLLQAHLTDAKQDVVERQALIDKLYSEKMDDLEMNKRRMQELQREKVKENEELETNIREIEERQRQLAEAEALRQQRLREQEEKLAKLRASGLSPEEMNRMMEKYQQEMDEWEKAVEEERRLQQEALQKRLEVKKQLHQKRLQEKLEAYKNENKRLLQKEPEKPKLQYQLDRPLRVYEPLADIESSLRLGAKDAGRGVEDVIDLLLRKVRRVEEMVAEVDTKHFEQAMRSLSQLNDLISQVRSR